MLATRLQQAQLLQDDAYFNSKKDEYFQMVGIGWTDMSLFRCVDAKVNAGI